MLIDGNDNRGIDVGIMTRKGFEIESIQSNVDTEDDEGIVFSRDCPQYELRIPSNLSMDGKNSVFRIFRQVQRSNKGLVV